MGLFHPELVAAFLIAFMVQRLSPFFSIIHRLLKGLHFWVPIPDSYLEALVPMKTKRSKKTLADLENERNTSLSNNVKFLMNNFIGEIQSNSLTKHSYYEYISLILNIFLSSMLLFIFGEIIPFFGRCTSTISFYIILFEIMLCLGCLFAWVWDLSPYSNEFQLIGLTVIFTFITSSVFVSFLPSFLDFDVMNSIKEINDNLNRIFATLNLPSGNIVSIVYFGAIFVIFISIISGLLLMSIFRFTRTYLEYINDQKSSPIMRFLFYVEFYLPFLITISFISPLFKNLIVYEGSNLTSEMWYSTQLWFIIIYCMIKMITFREHMQRFLLQAICQSVEDEYIELILKAPIERKPTEKLQFQLKNPHKSVYSHICVASVQYWSVVIILFSLGLILNRFGKNDLGFHWLVNKYLFSIPNYGNCTPIVSTLESLINDNFSYFYKDYNISLITVLNSYIFKNIISFVLFYLFLIISIQSVFAIVYWNMYLPGGVMDKKMDITKNDE